MNTRIFRSPSSSHHWKRLLLPASALAVVGALVVSRGAGFHAIHDHYTHIRSAWLQIPAVCTQDFPLTQFQTEQCDLYWKVALSRLSLVALPFCVAIISALGLRRRQKDFYTKAIVRVEVSTRSTRALGSSEQASGDLFSWLYSLKPTVLIVEGAKVKAYLSFDTPELKGDEVFEIYEVGRYFGKSRFIALIQKVPTHRVRTLQKAG